MYYWKYQTHFKVNDIYNFNNNQSENLINFDLKYGEITYMNGIVYKG